MDWLDELDEVAPLTEAPRVERPPEKPAPVRQRYVPPPDSSEDDEDEDEDEEEEEEEEEDEVVEEDPEEALQRKIAALKGNNNGDEGNDPNRFLAMAPTFMSFGPAPRREEKKTPPAAVEKAIPKTDTRSSAASRSVGAFSANAKAKSSAQATPGNAKAKSSAQATPGLPSYSDLLGEDDAADDEDLPDLITDLDGSGPMPAPAAVPKALAPAPAEVPKGGRQVTTGAPSTGGRRVTVGAPPADGSRSTDGSQPTVAKVSAFDLQAELKTTSARAQLDLQGRQESEDDDQSLEALLMRLDQEEEEEDAQQVWESFRELGAVEGREIQSTDAMNLPGLLGPSMKAITGPLVKVQEEQILTQKEDMLEFQAPDDEYISKFEERYQRQMEIDKAKREERDRKLKERVKQAMVREQMGGVRSVVPPAHRGDRLGLAALKPMGVITPSRAQTGTDVLNQIFSEGSAQIPRMKPAPSSR